LSNRTIIDTANQIIATISIVQVTNHPISQNAVDALGALRTALNSIADHEFNVFEWDDDEDSLALR